MSLSVLPECRKSVALALLLLVVSLAAQESARDAWQRPAEVLEALGIRAGSVVADIGCGRGYFTAHLARRVGAAGSVYAVEVDPQALAAVEELVARHGFSQVRVVEGQADDPRLPPETLDVALIVDSYHEFRRPDAMLEKIFGALKPGGLLGIIDRAAEPGQERASYLRRHRIPKEFVEQDAARHGFRFLREAPGFLRPLGSVSFYFLVFEKPEPGGNARPN